MVQIRRRTWQFDIRHHKAGLNWTGQGRTGIGQDDGGWDSTRRGRIDTGQCRTGQEKVWGTGQGRTRQGRMGQDSIVQLVMGQDKG